MAIKRGIVTFEFMYDDTMVTDAQVRGLNIEQIYNDCMDGDLIGKFDENLEIVEVHPDAVHSKLLAYGNDGTFFNY